MATPIPLEQATRALAAQGGGSAPSAALQGLASIPAAMPRPPAMPAPSGGQGLNLGGFSLDAISRALERSEERSWQEEQAEIERAWRTSERTAAAQEAQKQQRLAHKDNLDFLRQQDEYGRAAEDSRRQWEKKQQDQHLAEARRITAIETAVNQLNYERTTGDQSIGILATQFEQLASLVMDPTQPRTGIYEGKSAQELIGMGENYLELMEYHGPSGPRRTYLKNFINERLGMDGWMDNETEQSMDVPDLFLTDYNMQRDNVAVATFLPVLAHMRKVAERNTNKYGVLQEIARTEKVLRNQEETRNEKNKASMEAMRYTAVPNMVTKMVVGEDGRPEQREVQEGITFERKSLYEFLSSRFMNPDTTSVDQFFRDVTANTPMEMVLPVLQDYSPQEIQAVQIPVPSPTADQTMADTIKGVPPEMAYLAMKYTRDLNEWATVEARRLQDPEAGTAYPIDEDEREARVRMLMKIQNESQRMTNSAYILGGDRYALTSEVLKKASQLFSLGADDMNIDDLHELEDTMRNRVIEMLSADNNIVLEAVKRGKSPIELYNTLMEQTREALGIKPAGNADPYGTPSPAPGRVLSEWKGRPVPQVNDPQRNEVTNALLRYGAFGGFKPPRLPGGSNLGAPIIKEQDVEAWEIRQPGGGEY